MTRRVNLSKLIVFLRIIIQHLTYKQVKLTKRSFSMKCYVVNKIWELIHKIDKLHQRKPGCLTVRLIKKNTILILSISKIFERIKNIVL